MNKPQHGNRQRFIFDGHIAHMTHKMILAAFMWVDVGNTKQGYPHIPTKSHTH